MRDAVTPGQPVYRDQEVVAEASPSSPLPGSSTAGDGVEVEGIELGSAQGTLTYDPSNPLANKQGEVTYPDINIGSQMSFDASSRIHLRLADFIDEGDDEPQTHCFHGEEEWVLDLKKGTMHPIIAER